MDIQPKTMQGTLKSYITGFILSIVLTLAAFFVVLYPGYFHLQNAGAIATVLVLAVVQLFVQLIFFLHIGKESGPKWKLAAFASTLGIVIIIVIGSIWIMDHLNYNMMASPSEMNQYIQSQDTL